MPEPTGPASSRRDLALMTTELEQQADAEDENPARAEARARAARGWRVHPAHGFSPWGKCDCGEPCESHPPAGPDASSDTGHRLSDVASFLAAVAVRLSRSSEGTQNVPEQ